MEFRVDGKTAGVVEAAPYRIADVMLPPGRHVIAAVAVDDLGARICSAEVAIRIRDE